MKGTTRKQFFDEMAETQQRIARLQASEARLEQQVAALRRMVERMQVLREVGEAALAEQSPEAIAQLALERVKSLVPYRRASVALYDFEAYRARVLAVRYEDAAVVTDETSEGLGALGDDKIRALRQGESVLEGSGANFPLGPQVIRALKAEGVPSCLSVPLVAGGAPMGVLNVWEPSQGDFTAEHVEVVHDLAGVLAAALQQASSLEKLHRHARELVALYNAAQAMASNLDLQTTLKTVLGEARTLLQAEAASVLLQSGDTLVFEAAVGPGSEKIIGARLPITAGIVGWVLREKQPVRVNDAHRDTRFHAAVDQVTGLETRSVLAAPLIAKGDVSGVIEVVNKITPDGQFGAFYEQDLEILVAMAGPAAVAIENARLYQAKIKQFERLQARLAKR